MGGRHERSAGRNIRQPSGAGSKSPRRATPLGWTICSPTRSSLNRRSFTPRSGARRSPRRTLARRLWCSPTKSFRYVGFWRAETSAVLEFESTIDGVVVNGVDIIAWNADDRIVSFKVMARPWKGLEKLRALMAERLEAMKPLNVAAVADRGLVSPSSATSATGAHAFGGKLRTKSSAAAINRRRRASSPKAAGPARTQPCITRPAEII